MTQEEVVARYRNLAYSICNQFVRTYRIPKRDIPDLESELIAKLVASPASFHPNSSGMYTILKNGAIRWVERYRRSSGTTFSELEDDNTPFQVPDGTDAESDMATSLDYAVALSMIGELPGPERTCFTLFHGIGFDRPINVAMICRKLGAGRDWVERKIARAQKILQSRMKCGFSGAGEHRRCQSQS